MSQALCQRSGVNQGTNAPTPTGAFRHPTPFFLCHLNSNYRPQARSFQDTWQDSVNRGFVGSVWMGAQGETYGGIAGSAQPLWVCLWPFVASPGYFLLQFSLLGQLHSHTHPSIFMSLLPHLPKSPAMWCGSRTLQWKRKSACKT